jgi:hypothetical protein
MCPDPVFVESEPVPPEHEKYCVDVSHLGCTGMHYVTRRSHRMQKHKFGITCPDAPFVESVSICESTFHSLDTLESTT